MLKTDKPTVVFDLDDTLGDLKNPMSKAMSEHSGMNVHWKDWNDFNITHLYNLSDVEFYKVIIDSGILERMEPYKDTEAALTKLKKDDYNIVVITSRSYHPEALNITKRWFDKYGLPVDEVYVSAHGVNKLDYVKGHENILMFVDDRIENCESVIKSGRATHTYLYDQPWNAKSNLARVETLLELYKHW